MVISQAVGRKGAFVHHSSPRRVHWLCGAQRLMGHMHLCQQNSHCLLLRLNEWVGNLLASIRRGDQDNQGTTGDNETKRPRVLVALVVCKELVADDPIEFTM